MLQLQRKGGGYEPAGKYLEVTSFTEDRQGERAIFTIQLKNPINKEVTHHLSYLFCRRVKTLGDVSIIPCLSIRKIKYFI